MKGKLLRKMCAVSLSALLLVGGGAFGVMPFVDTAVTVSAAEATVIQSGSCGNNVTFELYDNGTIIISGTGAIWDCDLDSPFNKASITDVIIQEGVISIGRFAFEGCLNLRSATIPNSVTTIKSYAFYGCSNLTSVIIPSGITSIEEAAFYNCSSLTSVTIPDNITSIGRYAFYCCKSLTSVTIPDSVTSIEEGTFYDCSNLTLVSIPDSVTNIENNAFYNCESLTIKGKMGSYAQSYATNNDIPFEEDCDEEDCDYEYTVNQDGGVTITKYKGSDTDVVIPDIIEGKKVTSIGDSAFYDCSDLTAVTIADSVTSIANYAFSCCTSLTSVTIPDSVTSIGDNAFRLCTSLTFISIPDSVTSIGAEVFRNCTSLTSVTIPNSVTSIGGRMFFKCTGLTSIMIPNNVTSIGISAFESCKSLTSITIPDSVTIIGQGAFYGCNNLTSVTIPKSVTSIWGNTFSFCKSLTSVTIPDSVTSIDSYAFSECESLISVTIPKSVTSIGDGAFKNCNSLTIYGKAGSYAQSYAANNGIPFEEDGDEENCDYEYTVNQDGGVTITEYKGSDTEIVIPDIIDGKKVTSIGEYAFAWHENLISVTIPDSVTSIEDSAFSDCTGLTSINVSESNTAYSSKNGVLFDKNLTTLLACPCGKKSEYTIPDSVTSIGKKAFYGCTCLTSILIPYGVTSIGNESFGYCRNMTFVTLPDSLKSIGEYAFAFCTSLTAVTIPMGVTSIEHGSFSSCSSLASVTIPDSVKSIGDGAFEYCTSLTSVTIPDSVTSIKGGAFAECTSISAITIPDSVTSIEYYAFRWCTSLTSIIIPDSVTSIGWAAFYGCNSLTIYGKDGSYAETYARENNIPFEAVTIPLTNNSTLSADSILLGKSITVNCKASGGEAGYTYAVLYRKAGTTKWTTAQGYKTNATVKITPKAAVNYEIRVAVKDATGKIVRKDMTLAVKKPFTNTSKLNLETIKLGEKVKVRCFAENGETPYTFSVQYKKSTSEKWVNVAINSTNNIFVLKPASATAYDIRVTAKSPDGQASKKTLTLTVTK